MNVKPKSNFRTVRGYQLINRQELTPAMEDYLEMAYRLCLENDYTRVGKLSELLNVKPSSASKMISRLAELGYLRSEKYEIIRLTESGRKAGEYLLRRHDTVEKFLTLIDSPNPLRETELVEHSLSFSTVSDLNDLLEFFSLYPDIRNSFLEFKKRKALEST